MPSLGTAVRLAWPGGRIERVRLLGIGKSGGAGEVFAIEGRPELVAKIYHATIPKAQLALYEQKLRWMIAHPPELPAIPPAFQGIVQLAWPVALAANEAGFAGFVMEKIDFERTLEIDYLLTRRQAAGEGFEVDFGKLVTVCHNLATLIHCLHGRRIAVVDLKPVNLKVYKSELYVSILDCDGFTIHADGFVSEAPQVTPEYLAPEYHGQVVSDPRAQDDFALATIVFRLLNYGIHPFTGVAARGLSYPPELAGRIRERLYPYGRQPSATLRPAPASVHACFPDELRALFDRSFGAAPGGRARAFEWVELLRGYADRATGQMVNCERGHLQFAGKPCPSCLRESILQGHRARQRRFATRLQASPARAVRYVRRAIKGTQSSPFQAALAQGQLNIVQLAPVTLSIRNTLAIEIVWACCLIVTYWWMQ